MQAIAATFDTAIGHPTGAVAAAGRRSWRHHLLRLLDRLVPSRSGVDDTGPPPEFFKYPPV